MTNESKREAFEIIRSQLENERSSFIGHWRDLGDYILPRRPRFTVSETNQGNKKNQKIIDSTATLASRTLRSGLMGGVTSPARPWFRLTTPNPEVAERADIKAWLHLVNQRMLTVFIRSNLYNVLPIIYGDIGVFGTGAIFMEEDFGKVVQFYALPVGSYMLGLNDKYSVSVFMRDFRMTVRQVIDKFGKRKPSGEVIFDNFSDHIKHQAEAKQLESWVEVTHAIRPNPKHDPKQLDSKFKAFQSVYYERGTAGGTGANYLRDEDDKYLRESGYDRFPVLAPRWETTGEDVYGTQCPGMTALGDIKQLQLQEKRIAQAIEKSINPPMSGPTALRNQKATILPGDITYIDVREGQQGFKPTHEVRTPIGDIEQKQQQIRERISKAFYEDLFLMLAQSDRRQITAREIDERHEEKLLALGPVLQQLDQDLLNPLIDNTFEIMNRQGMVPPAPEEIQGGELKVEYISIMAQAQKLVGISTLERFTGFVGQVAQVNPEILDKVNEDEVIDSYGDMTSVPPGIIRSKEEVDEIRQQRAKAQAAQQQMEAMKQGAGAAKDLSQADTSGENALTQLMGGMGGAQQ